MSAKSNVQNFSASLLTAGVIAGLEFKQPEDYQIYVIASPLIIGFLAICFEYIRVWFGVESREEMSVRKNVNNRIEKVKKSLEDPLVSPEQKVKFQKQYDQLSEDLIQCGVAEIKS
ncbi:hypothetical protein [uncultured Psychrosphaera sp.]|uniref:hypothetical protein n=1 Tax=uncultured Psychrosphaera sp. TaxID=1403522 RepID=UPI00261FACFE|nr:hypothetical protein [uncultured Psychrosphaera sp.]